MSLRKNFRESNWLIDLSPRKNVELRIVGIRSTFRGSTIFRLVEIRLYAGSVLGGKMSRWKNFRQSNWLIELSPRKNVEPRIVGIRSTFHSSTFFRLVEIRLYTRFGIDFQIHKGTNKLHFNIFKTIRPPYENLTLIDTFRGAIMETRSH